MKQANGHIDRFSVGRDAFFLPGFSALLLSPGRISLVALLMGQGVL